MATVKYSGSRTVSEATSIRAVSHQLTLKPSRLDLRFLRAGAFGAAGAVRVRVGEVIREKPPGAG